MLSEDQVISNMRTGIIRWLDIKEKNILTVIAGDARYYLEDTRLAIADYFNSNVTQDYKAGVITIKELVNSQMPIKYDYIFMIGVLEFAENPAELIKCAYSMLKPIYGKLYLGLVNRFGLKYFIGDHDLYT